MENPIPLYLRMTSSSHIGGKVLIHKMTPHKFKGMMMSAFFVLVIGIDRFIKYQKSEMIQLGSQRRLLTTILLISERYMKIHR